jgi:O-antigen ligase
MQGVFAGPFHAALASVFLCSWAVCRWRDHQLWASAVLVVGAIGTYLTLVRTAYVAVALVLVTYLVVSTSSGAFLRRVGVLAVLGALVWSVLWFSDGTAASTVQSIGNYSSDSRVLNRFPEYQRGLTMIGESPIWGWGAGSAGDTLGPQFESGLHVTPHNIILKFAVEGGLVGLFCWMALFVALWRGLRARAGQAQLAIISAVGLLAMGTTGSAIEALPVSYLVLLVVGLGVATKPDDQTQLEVPASPGRSRAGAGRSQ